MKQEDAWDLLQELILEIFTEFRKERLGAQKTDDFAAYVWFTLKTHQVMQRYLLYDVRNDPALTSAITRYILRRLGVKTNSDVLQDKLVSLQSKENATDNVVRNLKTTVTNQGRVIDQIKAKYPL